VTDNERLTTSCPRCRGPGKVTRDFLGNESVECDALYPCPGPELPLDEKPAPLNLEGV
jgi:hypothetical protein